MQVLRYVLGPELIWLALIVWSKSFKGVNFAQEGKYNHLIENLGTWLPALLMTATMLLFAIPVVPRKFLLLRIIVVAVIASNFLLENFLNAHTQGGPGVGTIYIVAYVVLFVAIPVLIVMKYLLVK